MKITRLRPSPDLSRISVWWADFFSFIRVGVAPDGRDFVFCSRICFGDEVGRAPAAFFFALFRPAFCFLASIGSTQGVYGFFSSADLAIPGASPTRRTFSRRIFPRRAAPFCFPIYNEDAGEVYERLRASLSIVAKRTGEIDRFDFSHSERLHRARKTGSMRNIAGWN